MYQRSIFVHWELFDVWSVGPSLRILLRDFQYSASGTVVWESGELVFRILFTVLSMHFALLSPATSD